MAKVLFKFGTKAEYLALATKQENALYFLLDTGELYRGAIPFGQEHIYTGDRVLSASDASSIIAILNGITPVNNDICIIKNSDDTVNSYIYDAAKSVWNPLSMGSKYAELKAELEELRAISAGAFHFRGKVNDLVNVIEPNEGDIYQVGNKEYAWNSTDEEWIELGDTFDLSNYVTQIEFSAAVGNLETLIGTPESTEVDPETGDTIIIPATGLYADLQNHADQLIPIFDGATAGLVPVATGNLNPTLKANMFMNALGNWVTVNSGGQSIYTDPDGNIYNSVEAYVEHMVETYSMEWYSINEE